MDMDGRLESRESGLDGQRLIKCKTPRNSRDHHASITNDMDAIVELEDVESIRRRRGSTFISFTKPRERGNCCKTIFRARVALNYFILTTYEKALEKFGFFLARKPLVVLLVWLLVVIGSSVGFIRLHVEKPFFERFTATDSQSRKDLHRAAQFFPLLDARQEQFLMVPKQGRNILRDDCLKEAILVHQAVVNISGYSEVCSRRFLSNTTQKDDMKGCVISSPLELAGSRFENMRNLSSILDRELKNPTVILSTGETFNSSFNKMFSNFQLQSNTDPLTAQADAIRVIYFVQKTTGNDKDQAILDFENAFETLLLSMGRNLKCAALSFKTGKTEDDALQNVLQPELKPLCLSALVIVLIAVVVIYLSSNILNCLTTIILIISAIILPFICATGIISMANIFLFPTTLFIVFLLLGKATADVALLLGEWDRHKVPSLEHRVSNCVTRAGLPSALSALSGTILIGIAIKSSFDVISEFFTVAIVTFAVLSVSSFIVTVTLLTYFEKRLKHIDASCVPHCRRGSPVAEVVSLQKGSAQWLKEKLRHILRGHTQIITSLGGKVLSLFIFACIIGLCVSSALRPGERTGTTQKLYQNNHYKKFSEAQQKFFGKETDTSIVFPERIEYSRESVQSAILNTCKMLQEASYSARDSSCWMASLRQWARLKNMKCSNSDFYRCLDVFLNQTLHVPFRQDLHFAAGKLRHDILASRFHVQMVVRNRYREDRRSLEDLRKDLHTQSSQEAIPVSENFLELDDLSLLETDAVFVLIIANVVVFVYSLFASSSFRISTYLAITLDILVLEAAGIMEAWDIHLNHISFLVLYLTLILSLSFSIQVAHSFVFSEKQAVRDRMVEALNSVLWSLLVANLIAIAGSISLGLIYPSLAVIFTRLTPLVLVLGLIHALVIFPPFIVLIFEFVDSFTCQNDVDMLPTQTERNVMLSQLQDDHVQTKSKRPGISVVGISCRFPGANSKDLFWDLLEKGKSSIGAFPENRKEEHKTFLQLYHPKRFVSGRLCAVNGSYLEEIQNFDNRFFGISNQEARGMDPQQRILLQVVYEAIEDAGMRLEDLQKCRTGVFVGVMNLEYGTLVTDPSNFHNIDQFSSTGITASILANRVSFCLNLTGPSLAVDTACSSSLTALKLACDNLHNEDCDIAIICAPNIILDHSMQMVSSMAGLLAPDGRCKSFDASGDGYGRGEGFAAVILKLSNAALSDKDDEYCEIIAYGMNNDGQNAVPMTAPSAKMQAELSRMVLEKSGLNPEEVDYFEAHGTGTAIGDVIEVTSIADTYTRGHGKPTRKLRIGSVKSNLNHTESTSGLAGLIKVALMIKNKRLVPTINVNVLNPKLKLEEKGLVVQQTSEPWNKESGKPRIGAVNSFGYGGSNVHVILREVISKGISEQEEPVCRPNNILTISARSKEALQKMAIHYSEWLKDHVNEVDESFVNNLCYSLNERRSQLPHRLALAFGSTDDASKTLAAYANDLVGWDKVVSYGEVNSSDTKIVFMFGGQGSQWYAMGRQLIETEPTFKEAILTVSNIVKDMGMTWSLVDELMASEDKSRISENCIAQPATFAVQYATAQLLMSWRIFPSAVIGHSLGEFAAACVSGIITVKEAVQLVLIRSTLQDKCPNNGGMAALGMSEEKAKSLLTELKLSATLSIAAVNDAKSVTISGDSESIDSFGQHLAINANDTFWRVLGTKRAFHSSHMEVIKKMFQSAMKKITFKPKLSKIPMYSTVKGGILAGQMFTTAYWWQNIRCPVQFYPAMKNLLLDGYKQIIEISTQPILAHYVKQIAIQNNFKDQEMPFVMATLPRKRVPVQEQHNSFLQNTICKLYTLGYPIDWPCVQRNPSAKFVRSPNYPWLETSFWYREHPPRTIIPPLETEKDTKKQPHPFLEQVKMTDLFSGLQCWETEIDVHRFASLKDHALIQGGTVMPGAAYLEMAFAMAKDKFADIAGLELSDVRLSSLLTLPETQVRFLRLRLMKTDSINTTQFNITSVQDDQSEINLSSGRISVDLLHKRAMSEDEDPKQVGPAVNALMKYMTKMPMERFREITEAFGFSYGPTYSVIKQIWKCNNQGLCLIDISESLDIQRESADYVIHPSILDACLQSCFVPLGISSTSDKSIVPVGFKSITLNNVPSSNQLYCHVTADANDFGKFDVSLMNPSGNVLLTMCEFRIAELTSSPRQLGFVDLAYEVNWKEEELAQEERKESVEHLTFVVLRDSTDFSNNLIARLQAAKVKVITIDPPSDVAYNNEVQTVIETVISSIPKRDASNLRVINMWPVETTLLMDNCDVIDQAQSIAFSSSVFLIKLLVMKECLDSRLFLVTKSAQVLSSFERSPKTKSMPWASTVWGLRRTANLEEFSLRVTAIDLDSNANVDEIDSFIDEILGDSIEDEVAFRDGKRFVNRVQRLQALQHETTVTSTKETKKKHSLYLSTIPSSGKLCLREQSVSKPSSSELTINLLYFWTPSESLIDIAKSKGSVFVVGKVTGLPDKSDSTFQIGDEVCGALSNGRVSHSLSIQVSDAFKKPESLTNERAAFIPACLAIASHALQIAVSGGQNQKLLIHEANRGPGPAAVVLAKTLGHRVLCTIPDTCQTSTSSLLLELGAEGVFRQSSPNVSSDYNDPFDAVVFFYPPSPNALQKSSRSLKQGGKVIILSSEFHGDVVFQANTNVKYEREDTAHILRSPLVFEKLSLESIKVLEEKGALEKLLSMQLETVDLTKSIKGVNTSIDNQSTPKFHVKTFSDVSFLIYSYASFEDNHLQNIPVLPRGLDGCGLKGNRTYLVAGGMRGFGFEVARWMIENGARSLGLIGRSKPSEDKYQQLQEIERGTGAKIHTFQVDISNQNQMAAFKQQLQSLPSVAGIVHTAMVLRDEFIKDLTFESFTEVMGPKIKGSFLLHQMSLEMDLDFFVMFSSMASIVGNMGQSSYSACNAFQDSLAQYRRHVLGLPGLAINWGPISGAGVMERETGIVKLMNKIGLGFIHAKEGAQHMAKVLTEEPGRCQISLFDADWPRFIKSNPGLRKTSRLSDITVEINAPESQTRSTESLAQRIILEKDAEKRAELVNEYVAILVTEWTGISSPSETDLNKSLYSYGADSTASLTLKMQLESNLQVSFEVFYFMQPDTTPLKMAKDITVKLGAEESNSKPSSGQPEQSENREEGPPQTQPTADTSQSEIAPANKIQVVPLYTPASSAIKFFCVHPSHRYAMSLVPISTGFQGQELVSFYALGFTDPTAVSDDWGGVRELASHYVQLISEEQRHGPYFLGGYSYGGLLAYEMASLLTEQNQRVECVAMIDTFPWSPLSQTISTRLASMQEDGNSQRRHVKLQFENFLKKLALDSLKMGADEYRHLRGKHNQDGAIDELQRRSLEKGLTTHNLRALRESLLRDQTIASRTHHEWQPPEVRYRGPLTFLKCQNTRYSPTRLRSSGSVEEVWGQLVDGGTTVLVCPGDHYSLSELPHAHVTGSILATALAFSYRMLFPEFPRPSRTFHQRRAVEKFCNGVKVFLHSKRGNKRPHFGELHFQEFAFQLKLKSIAEEGETNEYEKTKKTIDLKDLRMVQPGRLVSSALKHAGRKRRVRVFQSGNLGQVASVITSERVYNLEFTDYSDLKAFYNMIEAVFAVVLLAI